MALLLEAAVSSLSLGLACGDSLDASPEEFVELSLLPGQSRVPKHQKETGPRDGPRVPSCVVGRGLLK